MGDDAGRVGPDIDHALAKLQTNAAGLGLVREELVQRIALDRYAVEGANAAALAATAVARGSGPRPPKRGRRARSATPVNAGSA